MDQIHSRFKECLSRMTIRQILDAVRKDLHVPHSQQSPKEKLVHYVASMAPRSLLEEIEISSQSPVSRPHKRRRSTSPNKKNNPPKKHRRNLVSIETPIEKSLTSDCFFKIPSEDELKCCYHNLYSATSNDALTAFICGVCGRESNLVEGETKASCRRFLLDQIPHVEKLRPLSLPHINHTLYNGYLLDPHGVFIQNEQTVVDICDDCYCDLCKKGSHPPQYSLANNLWIGPIPWELQCLTFPEQLLIALVYPRVYIFKLFPKKRSQYPMDQLQSGMRGNVVSYEQDMAGIASMIEGQLMPRPVSLLASILSITYIGVGPLPKNWLHWTFHVRRAVVRAALIWLQKNNPTYYGDIKLDEHHLNLLPEDDVPQEILGIIRQSTDSTAVDKEHEGYMSSHETTDIDDLVNKNDEMGPDVIPLQISGGNDADLTSLSANDIMKWGLANLWQQGNEGGYAVRHGQQPVRDFPPRAGEPNYFERVFPTLFPYGVGGIEAARPVKLEYKDHIRWALRYHDRRFRRHESFSFIAFAILQRRQALMSARLQMQRRSFARDAQVISTIRPEDLLTAQHEESLGHPISNHAVKILFSQVRATAARVIGSDAARYRNRSKMWSTTTSLNPPSLWLTINFNDLHDPIAQIFAGETINMDDFQSSDGPSSQKRAQNIARDPYAAAAYFHFMIKLIFRTLLGIERTPYQVKTHPGVLGHLSAYFGSVESQGRGSLHQHTHLWMKDALTSVEMQEKLQSSDFREKIAAYIAANIHAHISGVDSSDSLHLTHNEVDVGYARALNPESSDFWEKFVDVENRVARAKQIHTCQEHICLVPDKHGNLHCKRHAPFPCSDTAFIDVNGNWNPKRIYEYVNSWCPAISVFARCNNDIKLLTNGPETKSTTIYSTSYASKNQQKTHNLSAVTSRELAYQETANQAQLTSLREQQRHLLFRLVHRINCEQEMSGPMVISLLMGWGDSYQSHNYTTVYWSSFVATLLHQYPELKTFDRRVDDALPTKTSKQIDNESIENIEIDDDIVQLETNASGTLSIKCQVTDYSLRGSALEHFSVYDFYLETWESYNSDPSVHYDDDYFSQEHKARGRPKTERIPYLSTHPAFASKARVIRSTHHNNLPNFVGSHFPRNNDSTKYTFYCATMLMLLKPWRQINKDLKNQNETWQHAFTTFVQSTSQRNRDILNNIQYYHECRSAAENDHTKTFASHFDQREDEMINEDDEENLPNFSNDLHDSTPLSHINLAEEAHGRLAIIIAEEAGIFPTKNSIWEIASTVCVRPAQMEDFKNLEIWETYLAEDSHRNENASITGTIQNSLSNNQNLPRICLLPDVQPLSSISSINTSSITTFNHNLSIQPEYSNPLDISNLNPDQKRAYDIVLWHLYETLQNHHPPPLRMILHGEGGTGKSHVIQTITEGFRKEGVQNMLLKAAYTGIAASSIEGQTLHSIAKMSFGKQESKVTDQMRDKLQAQWRPYEYCVIDEYSMIAKRFLAKFSRNVAIGKAMNQQKEGSFGGINVILCGDIHQFPPVATAKADALYNPISTTFDSINSTIGRQIYEEFTTVVILKEQNRIKDPIWLDFLQCLRFGQVEPRHLKILRSLLIQNNHDDYSTPPWSDAVLITPRHAVRTQWNEASLKRHCQQTKHQIFICSAEDRIRGQPLSNAEQIALQHHNTNKPYSQTPKKDLPTEVRFAIGAKVLVTQNLDVDLDITNGARGEIVDIILHPDEPPISTSSSEILLKFMPLYILVKMNHTRASCLPNLTPNIIPIQPTSRSISISLLTTNNEKIRRTIQRRQFPMTLGYAFTDYRSQGQTMPYVIIDIAKPPSGKLNLFNLYVALSRSHGRHSIRLLRDFDDDIFLTSHDNYLLQEDDRLNYLNSNTQNWWNKMRSDTKLNINPTSSRP